MPMFQKRHHRAIANAIAGATSVPDALYRISVMFQCDNGRFDCGRFINACEGCHERSGVPLQEPPGELVAALMLLFDGRPYSETMNAVNRALGVR